MGEKPNQILLTFVVPCYNVEKYIQRCLDSIYACGLRESLFEVVCVNDCSPDGTAAILERNKNKHTNLRVINHEVNRGLGGGRNTGICEAKGRYLWFIDSDDEIVADGFADALEKTVASELDVLCFNYCRIDEERKQLSRHEVFTEVSVSDGYAFSMNAFPGGIIYHLGFVWRFLYKTDFLRSHQLFFPEQVHWEDTVFMPKSILLAERIASVSQVFYAYRVNPDSISGVFGKAYPATSIYDWSFCAGVDLLNFSDEVRDEDLKGVFRDTAINRYINGFAVHLLRADKKERTRFYGILKENHESVRALKPYMNMLNKALLIPLMGPMVANLMSWVYKTKHGERG